jgi:hypothetical protein
MKVGTPAAALSLLTALLVGVAALDAIGIIGRPLFELFWWMSP